MINKMGIQYRPKAGDQLPSKLQSNKLIILQVLRWLRPCRE